MFKLDNKIPCLKLKLVWKNTIIASAHCKGREERKTQQHKSLSKYKIIRPGTRMTRIKRIFTDNPIRTHPRHPCNPCSIVYNSNEKIRY